MTQPAAGARTRGKPGDSAPTPAPYPPATAFGDEAEATALLRRADPRLVGLAEEDRDLRFYRRMRFIRRFEERLLELFDEGLLNGTTHACIGQEADSVGVIDALRSGDHIFSNHRCHGHYLAWTGDAVGLLAEIMGKRDGVVGGVGGSQHIAAPGFKSNGILGGTVPAAAGIALAMKLSGVESVSAVFMGDGSFGEGVVYETLNIAALWKLPIFFVVENNGYSQSTPLATHLSGDIGSRFAAFGIPFTQVDSTDVRAIQAAAQNEIDLVRSEGTPRALIIDTYRLCHHSKSDDNRPEEEIAARWETEPLRIHGARLDQAARDRVDAQVEEGLEAAVQSARSMD